MRIPRIWLAVTISAVTCFIRGNLPAACAIDEMTGERIDGTLEHVTVERAFPKLTWPDWQPENERGVNVPFRTVLITNAGDGSNRLFVVEQHGKVYQFANDQDVTEARLFFDISHKVRYSDNQNEEGFLGFAFHPKFKQNGQVVAYYTLNKMPRESVISRFRLSKDGSHIDPATEQELLRVEQPFWNHNGGTVAFGPDGYLYIGLGDGGSGNDPQGNGQNLGTLLGSILRIDIDKKSRGRPYAIPKDNPFIKRPGARPEIYAYGLRNVWRLSFDPVTKLLWAGDVGQNRWEEIDLIERGGNYGWSVREGFHRSESNSSQPNGRMIEPIWDYSHKVGQSITGGCVYRGKEVPELIGKYLYADYVSGKIWALDYDTKAKRVRGNYRIDGPMIPVTTFGEDESGEVYLGRVAADGRGLYRFRAR